MALILIVSLTYQNEIVKKERTKKPGSYIATPRLKRYFYRSLTKGFPRRAKGPARQGRLPLFLQY